MVRSLLGLLSLALLPLSNVLAADQAVIEEELDQAAAPNTGKSASPNFDVSATFPQSEIFGVKLVNRHQTTALISVTNKEPTAINLRFVRATLWTPIYPGQESQLIRNLSTTSYNNGRVPPGESESFSYKFTVDMHPQDVRLVIGAVLMDDNSGVFAASAYNETVSVVEAPTSIFDPQILFLYIVLAGVFAGTAYFIYKTWISTLFPQQKKRSGNKGGVKATPKGGKRADGIDDGFGADATTTGSKSFDASWIPEGHLKRPEAKRIRSSGTPSGVKTKRTA